MEVCEAAQLQYNAAEPPGSFVIDIDNGHGICQLY